MTITIKGTVQRLLVNKPQFKILSIKPDEEFLDLVQVHPVYKNISAKGFGTFEVGANYEFILEEDKLYQGEMTYSFKVNNDSRVQYTSGSFANKTKEQQALYLNFTLSEEKANLIAKQFPFSSHPNLVDDIASGKIDLTAVKGIGEKTAEKLKHNIIENMKSFPLIAKLSSLGATEKMMEKISETFGGSTRAVELIEESFYNLCKVKGLGFKKVDSLASRQPDANPKDPKRIEAFLNYTLHEMANQGHCWQYKDKLIKESAKELELNEGLIENFLNNLTEIKDVQIIIVDEEKVAYSAYYNHEMTIKTQLDRINSNYNMVNADLKLAQGMKDAEQLLGITYTEEQRETITESFKHGVFIINGKAGTGKSTIMKGITKICDNLNLTYHSMALSGRATQLLTLKGIKSSTIHKAMIEVEKYNRGASSEEEQPPYPNLYSDVIIIEESSMIESGLWAKFLVDIKDGARIIIVGDTGQLSGIGHGDVLRDLLATDKYARKELIQIHRQAKESAIIKFADMVREGQQFVQPIYDEYDYEDKELLETYAEKGDLYLMTKKRKEDVAEEAFKFITNRFSQITEEEIMNYQILCPNKDRGEVSTSRINEFVQDVYIPKNQRKKVYETKYSGNFYVGDKVIVNGNTYNKPYKPHQEEEEDKVALTNLFNGTMGIIRDIVKPKAEFGKEKPEITIYVEFEGIDGIVPLSGKEINSINLAYAITIHRSQGMTIENVLVLMDYSAFTLLSKQILYTGSTRASKKCLIIAEHNAIAKALKTDSSGLRRTFLADEIRKSS